MRAKRYIVGIDMGSTKVCAVVGKASDGSVETTAYGLTPSAGMRRGIIADIDAAAGSLRQAVTEVESSSALSIKAAYIGISARHIQCIQSYGAVGIKGKAVTEKDVRRAISAGSTVYIPLDRDVVHIMPSEFAIDGLGGIVRPVGMSGVRLEARVNIITAPHSMVSNLKKCCERAGIRAIAVVLGPIASAKAVLEEDELEAGVLLIDIGGGTTGIALFKHGRLKHITGIPVGGSHLTGDIAVGLRVSQKEAERIKKKYGCALPELAGKADEMEISDMNGEKRRLPRRYIVEIIRPRCMELFELIKAGVNEVVYSATLTGGTSLLPGIERVAEAGLGMPVRGRAGVTGPSWHGVAETAIGLVRYGAEMEADGCVHSSLFERLMGRFKQWNINRFKGGVYVFRA